MVCDNVACVQQTLLHAFPLSRAEVEQLVPAVNVVQRTALYILTGSTSHALGNSPSRIPPPPWARLTMASSLMLLLCSASTTPLHRRKAGARRRRIR